MDFEKHGPSQPRIFAVPEGEAVPEGFEEIELAEPAKPCDHITGYRDEYELHADDPYGGPEKPFNFCPDCGEKLR